MCGMCLCVCEKGVWGVCVWCVCVYEEGVRDSGCVWSLMWGCVCGCVCVCVRRM